MCEGVYLVTESMPELGESAAMVAGTFIRPAAVSAIPQIAAIALLNSRLRLGCACAEWGE